MENLMGTKKSWGFWISHSASTTSDTKIVAWWGIRFLTHLDRHDDTKNFGTLTFVFFLFFAMLLIRSRGRAPKSFGDNVKYLSTEIPREFRSHRNQRTHWDSSLGLLRGCQWLTSLSTDRKYESVGFVHTYIYQYSQANPILSASCLECSSLNYEDIYMCLWTRVYIFVSERSQERAVRSKHWACCYFLFCVFSFRALAARAPPFIFIVSSRLWSYELLFVLA